MSPDPRSVALFDFDHTLILGDSFMPFLTHVAGFVPTVAAAIESLAMLAVRRAQGHRPETRSFIKNYLIRKLLTGKRLGQIGDAAIKMHAWQKINVPIMNALREHRANGDMIVIASGGLNLYLPEMLRDIPHDALICTDIGIENGVITGEMIHGNCVREGKAERVAGWLAANGPFDQSWAYGNYPHDVPMMQLVKHRIIVS